MDKVIKLGVDMENDFKKFVETYFPSYSGLIKEIEEFSPWGRSAYEKDDVSVSSKKEG